jgi:hypothetical protein
VTLLRSILPAVVALTVTTGPGQALEYQRIPQGRETAVLVSGEFLYGDEKGFRREINAAKPVSEVIFASPGGNVFAALEIGRFLRQSGLPTRVGRGQSCASACVYALIGGIFRTVDNGARVGVHMSSLSGDRDIIREVTEMIRRRGPAGAKEVIAAIEQSAASIMAAQAKFLVEMSVSMELMHPITDTETGDMHWLTRRELERYNIVN